MPGGKVAVPAFVELLVEVDGVDVSWQVGREEADTAERTGGEDPAMDGGDMIVQPGHTDPTPGAGALEAPVFGQDVSLERRLALELFGAVTTPSLHLAGGDKGRPRQPRMVNGLVSLQGGCRGEGNITGLAAVL